MKRRASMSWIMRAMVTVLALRAFGQQPQGALAFEVASVKPGNPQFIGPRLVFSPGGRIRAESVTLRGLIEEAYQLKPFQLTGASGPLNGWIDADRFQVIASGGESASNDQLRSMLQSLLAERFRLVVHRETKEQAISVLLVKGKPKLEPAKEGSRYSVATSTSGRGATSNHVAFSSTSMARLADVLTRQLGHLVMDQTGLAGEFDFEFDAEHDESEPNPFIAAYAPALSQIGLRLESRKGPVEFMIVEHAEKPSEN